MEPKTYYEVFQEDHYGNILPNSDAEPDESFDNQEINDNEED